MGTPQVLRSLKESLAVPSWCQKALAFGKEEECVKVEALRGCSEVDVEGKKYMPVMVRVTAAAPRPQLRTAVDVVAVLDVSSYMKGKMEEMKDAMRVVIESLGSDPDSDNQLSLVLFDDGDKHQTPADDNQHSPRVKMGLKRMTGEGREEATRVINSLPTSNDNLCYHSVAEALGAANKILTERSGPKGGCIMLLSGGEGKVISTSSLGDELQFPVHTFGLGADHDAESLRSIASNSAAGTYSFIDINNGKQTTDDAFKAFMGRVTSIAATSVEIRIKAQDGFKVSSTVPESYKELQRKESGHVIQISDMYAGQTKNFIVYLQNLQGDEVSAATTAEKLVAVEGSYQQGGLPTGSTARKITVTHHSSPGTAVAAELLRIKLVKQITSMVGGEDATLDVLKLQLAWEKEIKVSAECQGGADSTALSAELEKDVDEMIKSESLPYMLSWLSCHEWQRATTMLHHSCAFQVTDTSSTYTWGWELVRKHRWSHLTLLVCGVVFLFALWVTLLRTRQKEIVPIPLPDLDIRAHHPSWSTINNNLDGLLHMTKQGEFTSFFRNQKASPHDMNQQIDQYLYMAIVYAAVLRAHYDGTADISEKVVRHKTEVYLHSMLKRTKQYTLPSMEDASLEHVTGEMSWYLYSTIAQANVLVTISTPPDTQPDPPLDLLTRVYRFIRVNFLARFSHPFIGISISRFYDQLNWVYSLFVPQQNSFSRLINWFKYQLNLAKKIKELEELVDKLQIENTKLRIQKDSCCQRAIMCRNKVKELGGSVDDDETTTYVIDMQDHIL